MTIHRSTVIRLAAATFALGSSLLAGCGVPPEVEIGFRSSTLLDENALSPNALSPNALSPNALNPSALSPTSLSQLQLNTQDGINARQLLKYTVGCSYRPDQSYSYSWTDAQGTVHNETLWGILGLAPEWNTVPLSATKQGWVSACLASRCNYYGVTVMLSTRGDTNGLDWVDNTEKNTWGNIEGAFWGNAFASPTRLYACYKTMNVAHSRAMNRVCSSGLPSGQTTTECAGIKVLGDCDDLCTGVSATTGFYGSCTGPDGTTSQVMTVFLQ